jgi:hypothetical protein
MSHTEEVKLYLETLKKDLPVYKEAIYEVSSDIRKEKFSDYPIFIATQLPVEIGEMILDRDELETNWSIYASTLEEFLERKIILQNKKEDFIKSWKDPETHCCIFLITPLGASFLYIPFKKNIPGFDFVPN